MSLEYAPIVIIACCILHNFLIEKGDIGGDDQTKNQILKPLQNLNTYLKMRGSQKILQSNKEKQYLIDE